MIDGKILRNETKLTRSDSEERTRLVKVSDICAAVMVPVIVVIE